MVVLTTHKTQIKIQLGRWNIGQEKSKLSKKNKCKQSRRRYDSWRTFIWSQRSRTQTMGQK